MSSTNTESGETEAIRANKLELVERLADDLAHEIKNPLHSMVINLEVLKRRIARLDEEKAGELMRYADVLNGELERVSRRVDLLLRLARPERGAEPTTLPAVVDELLELLVLERERHGIAMDFHPAPQPLRGHLPREPTRQMVLNLLLEALDRLAPGGRLDIVTGAGDGWSHLRLEGVAPENAAPPVPTGEWSSARIPVVRELARSLQGSLEVGEDGAPGAPSALRFTLSLPLATRG